MDSHALELYRAIADNLSQGLYVLQDDRLVFVNGPFAEIFGYASAAALQGRNLFCDVYPDSDSLELFRQCHLDILQENTPRVSWAQLATRADGGSFWLEAEAKGITLNGRPAVLVTLTDQTDCQFMAEAMAVSQQTLQSLLDAMEDRVYVVDQDHRMLFANRKMRETGFGRLESDPCYRVCRDLDEPCSVCKLDEVILQGRKQHKEFYLEAASAWYSSIEIPIRLPGRTGLAKLAVARDITTRKQNEERIRALSHRLLTAQEDERASLSRELHDDLGQRINAARIAIETLAQDCLVRVPEQKPRFQALNSGLQDTLDAVRRLSSGLRPVDFERLGVAETLRDLCDKVATLHGIAVDYRVAGLKGLPLSNESQINLFRIAQEALNNSVKHARASSVSVRLVASHPQLRLRISDNGAGFDPQLSAGGGLGLSGMAERVQLLGGRFSLKSAPGEGTAVTVDIPCAAE